MATRKRKSARKPKRRGKLTGAAKTAFLRRMAAGRRKASGGTTKRKRTSKRRRTTYDSSTAHFATKKPSRKRKAAKKGRRRASTRKAGESKGLHHRVAKLEKAHTEQRTLNSKQRMFNQHVAHGLDTLFKHTTLARPRGLVSPHVPKQIGR